MNNVESTQSADKFVKFWNFLAIAGKLAWKLVKCWWLPMSLLALYAISLYIAPTDFAGDRIGIAEPIHLGSAMVLLIFIIASIIVPESGQSRTFSMTKMVFVLFTVGNFMMSFVLWSPKPLFSWLVLYSYHGNDLSSPIFVNSLSNAKRSDIEVNISSVSTTNYARWVTVSTETKDSVPVVAVLEYSSVVDMDNISNISFKTKSDPAGGLKKMDEYLYYNLERVVSGFPSDEFDEGKDVPLKVLHSFSSSVNPGLHGYKFSKKPKITVSYDSSIGQ